MAGGIDTGNTAATLVRRTFSRLGGIMGGAAIVAGRLVGTGVAPESASADAGASGASGVAARPPCAG